MLRNYFKSSLRSLWREGGYTALNVVGLAVALAVCVLMGLYIRFQTSFDEFHDASERIARIVQGEYAKTAYNLGPTLVSELPKVEQAVRIQRMGRPLGAMGQRVQRGDQAAYERQLFYADSTFFEVFGFKLKRGDPAAVLSRPFTIVLTERLAAKYFGNADPIGQTVQIGPPGDAHTYEVTGIAQDPPPNTHLSFTALSSFSTLGTETLGENLSSWFTAGGETYLQLAEGAERTGLGEGIAEVFSRHRPNVQERDPYRLQPISSIHLSPQLRGEHRPAADPAHLYVFGSLAILLLILACVNYVNLATARATRRASEVGIRKAVGSSRRLIAGQFLTEAVLTGLVAGGLAWALTWAGLPRMEALTGTPLTEASTTSGWAVLAGTVGGGLIAGLLAGVYPALVLSGLEPASVLRGRSSLMPSGEGIRKALIGLQFAISVGFIAATLVIQGQLDYMRSTDLGLQADQVVVIPTRGNLGQDYQAFKTELEQRADISAVSAAVGALPFSRQMSATIESVGEVRPETMSQQEYERREEEGSLKNHPINVADGFTEALGVSLIQGRRFSDASGSSDSLQAIINQMAARQFGWDRAVGKTIYWHGSPVRVIGMTEDFHYRPLDQHIRPLTLIKMPGRFMDYVFVRFEGSNTAGVVDALQNAWAQFGDGTPLEYTFLDQRFAQVYRSQQRLASVASTFSVIAIVLAGLGLSGLASYTVSQRRREISIRKVMGANLRRIVATVSGEFLKLVGWGAVLALPVTALLIHRWLSDFAYRIELGPAPFLIAGILSLGVAAISVTYQSLTAALLNPAEALRQE